LWQQLLFLELRCAEATGPEPKVASGFDHEMPQNVDDSLLILHNQQLNHDQSGWSESTPSLVRYECYQIHRNVFKLRDQLTRDSITLTSALETLDDLQNRFHGRYDKCLSGSSAIKRYTRSVCKLLLARSDLMLLQTQEFVSNGRVLDVAVASRLVRGSRYETILTPIQVHRSCTDSSRDGENS
jgi:hypothetical protein